MRRGAAGEQGGRPSRAGVRSADVPSRAEALTAPTALASPPAEPAGTARTRPGWALIVALSATVALLHVVVAAVTPYEFHRDELLYLAMGRHLALFGMDFPPFIALLAEAERALFGDSLVSIRLGPALAHGALVGLTGWIAWALGGGRFAQALAMAPVATAPLFLRAGSLFQPVIFDQLWWTAVLAALVVVAGSAHGEPQRRAWLAVGVAAGLGLLTKFSIAFLGAGVLAALLVAGRAHLKGAGPWLALAIGLLVGAPSIAGQVALGFPVVTQMGDLQDSQLERIEYADWWLELVLQHGPVAFALAVAGVVALVAGRRLARWRVVAWSALVAFAIIMLLRGKPYYVGPVFPALYAAGAVVLESRLREMRGVAARRAVQTGTIALAAAWGLSVLPIALPLFPPERTARFAARLGLTHAVTTNTGETLELPQDYADMLGWANKVERIARVWHALPAADRERAVIVADNYGQAGAVDLYGPRHGLPGAIAPVGSYWFWGPGEKPGDVVVKIGGTREDLLEFCGSVELATRIDEPWLVPEERDLAIWICREPRGTLQQVWPLFEGQN